jgi:hypothetical protein
MIDVADLTKWKLVPVEPTDELLRSMAVRYDHGLGCPGYYDQFGEGEHEKRLRAAMTTMRQLHEEVVGAGFHRPASPAPSLPTREEIARVLCESRIIYYDSYDRRMRIGLHGDSDVTEKVERLTAAILALFAQPQEKKQGSVEPPPSP